MPLLFFSFRTLDSWCYTIKYTRTKKECQGRVLSSTRTSIKVSDCMNQMMRAYCDVVEVTAVGSSLQGENVCKLASLAFEATHK